MAHDRVGRDVFARAAPEGLRTVRKSVWQAEIYDLIAAYGRVSARTRPVMHIVAERPVMTLEAAIERVSRLVGQRIDWATSGSRAEERRVGKECVSRCRVRGAPEHSKKKKKKNKR